MTQRDLFAKFWIANAAVALGVSIVLGLAGCASLQRQTLSKAPDGTVVERVTGFSDLHSPVAAGTFTQVELENSLRRITVRYHKVISILLDDPVSLLSEDQVKTFAVILYRELPTLAPNQRLRITFRDVKDSNISEMDVYWDQPNVVYAFNLFAVSRYYAPGSSVPPASLANIKEMPGQKALENYPSVVVKDALVGGPNDTKVVEANKLAALNAARAKDVLDPADYNRLQNLVKSKPEILMETLQRYLEKRETLKKARDQGLMDDAGYQAQLVKVEAELTP